MFARHGNAHFVASYGIFAGEASQTAVLRFTAERTRRAADEQWPPQQQGKSLPDGCFELRILYVNETELVMGILKHGAAVEVIAPESLRRTIERNILEMQEIYIAEKVGKK